MRDAEKSQLKPKQASWIASWQWDAAGEASVICLGTRCLVLPRQCQLLAAGFPMPSCLLSEVAPSGQSLYTYSSAWIGMAANPHRDRTTVPLALLLTGRLRGKLGTPATFESVAAP